MLTDISQTTNSQKRRSNFQASSQCKPTECIEDDSTPTIPLQTPPTVRDSLENSSEAFKIPRKQNWIDLGSHVRPSWPWSNSEHILNPIEWDDDFFGKGANTFPIFIKKEHELDELRLLLKDKEDDDMWVAQGLRGKEVSYYMFNEFTGELFSADQQNLSPEEVAMRMDYLSWTLIDDF